MPEPIEIAPGVLLGGGELPVIAGPCAVESEELVLETAGAVKAIGERLGTPRHTDLAYWETPIDHTFKGTYQLLARLGTKDLELEQAFGVSLFQFTMAWRLGLKALPAPVARALWQTMDAVGRRLPDLADTGIAIWRKQG